jgi:hypothetical protein
MSGWKRAVKEGMVAGSVASLASTAALAMAGHCENGHPAAPVNAISHWFWDPEALGKNGPSIRHTLTGFLVHHGASVFWATLHARAWGDRPQAVRPVPALAGAAAAAAVACFVDLRMTPRRLTPGFEHRISSGSMAGVYACFALGLALGSMAIRRSEATRTANERAEAPPASHQKGTAALPATADST